MTNWLERAKHEILKNVDRATANSAEGTLSAVIAVPNPTQSRNWDASIGSNGSNGSNALADFVETETAHASPKVRADDTFGNSTAAVFMARLTLFTDRGLSTTATEAMAKRLELRDGERDERRLCLECRNLSGSPKAWRCAQWRRIGQINGAAIPDELVRLLQRCAGYHDVLRIGNDKAR